MCGVFGCRSLYLWMNEKFGKVCYFHERKAHYQIVGHMHDRTETGWWSDAKRHAFASECARSEPWMLLKWRWELMRSHWTFDGQISLAFFCCSFFGFLFACLSVRWSSFTARWARLVWVADFFFVEICCSGLSSHLRFGRHFLNRLSHRAMCGAFNKSLAHPQNCDRSRSIFVFERT